jgi:Cof subfamily protein (haloacid dehalogenase superfamily)
VEVVSSAAEESAPIRLVVSDIDGTLLDPQKKLTPGAPAAVEKLRAAGMEFTLTSARPPRLTRELISVLQITEPVACFNGALISRPDGTALRELAMLPGDAQTVADNIRKLGLDLWLFTASEWYVSDPVGARVAHHEGLWGGQASLLENYDMSQYRVLKLVGVSENHELVAKGEAEVNGIGGLTISATRSAPYYLDVTHAKANKGEVILALSEMLGIPREQIATLGDMDTDVLGFRQAGTSIAMGNALDNVKQAATFVTKSNTEDGFAWAVENIILKRAGQVAAD